MTTNTQLEQLESAIDNHLQAAQQERDKILADSAKRIQQR